MARTQLHHIPARLATGAFIVNSGINKLRCGEEMAKGVHGMASGTYPVLKDMDPVQFTKALGAAEVALGAALVVPVIPTSLAAAGLTAFASGLLGLYARTPGMRQAGSWRPSQDGTALAKDVWLAGIGVTLLMDSAATRLRRGAATRGGRVAQKRVARKAAKKAAASAD
jgi:hypothetical protein